MIAIEGMPIPCWRETRVSWAPPCHGPSRQRSERERHINGQRATSGGVKAGRAVPLGPHVCDKAARTGDGRGAAAAGRPEPTSPAHLPASLSHVPPPSPLVTGRNSH